MQTLCQFFFSNTWMKFFLFWLSFRAIRARNLNSHQKNVILCHLLSLFFLFFLPRLFLQNLHCLFHPIEIRMEILHRSLNLAVAKDLHYIGQASFSIWLVAFRICEISSGEYSRRFSSVWYGFTSVKGFSLK